MIILEEEKTFSKEDVLSLSSAILTVEPKVGANLGNEPQKGLIITSICNFHRCAEVGANFGSFCNLIAHCSPTILPIGDTCVQNFLSHLFLFFLGVEKIDWISIWGC